MPFARSPTLETLCAALVDEMTLGTTFAGDLEAGFAAAQRCLTQAIRDVAREWNSTHDRLGVLPAELRAACWSYLPQPDLVQLACVCSSWRDLSRRVPALWTQLAISRIRGNLDSLFSRSAQLPLDVSVTITAYRGFNYVDSCIRKQAHRLSGLQIILDHGSHIFHSDPSATGEITYFRYPAPVLEKLSFTWPISDASTIGPSLFAGSAPNLRILTLDGIALPPSCPAFSGVHTLTIRGSSDLQHMFRVAPYMEELTLINTAGFYDAPHVPSPTRLRTMTVHIDCFLSVPELVARGYLRIPQMYILTTEPVTLFSTAAPRLASLDLTVSIHNNGGARATLSGPTGGTASFTVNCIPCQTLAELIQAWAASPALNKLSLPSAVTGGLAVPDGNVQYPYLSDTLSVPSLRTLTIVHGASGGCSLLEPVIQCSTIVAPLLSSVEIVCGDVETASARAAAINPAHLALFITRYIECSDRSRLELIVDDGHHDIVDTTNSAGMEDLRRCVGKVTFRSAPSGGGG